MVKEATSFFKRGELDFKKILFQQIDRTMEKLTEGDRIGFVDGVEGIYLLLFYYLDGIFKDEDNELFKELGDEKASIDSDLKLFDKSLMFTALGFHIAKKRLANLIKLAGRKRLLLETRRVWDERKQEGTEVPDEELRRIVEERPDEEENQDSTSEN